LKELLSLGVTGAEEEANLTTVAKNVHHFPSAATNSTPINTIGTAFTVLIN
jgi:hypothetical protein